MKDFSGKTVIITGSSKGIGKTTALAFLAAGANVVLNGRNRETLDATRMEMESLGYRPLAIPADVSNMNECHRLVRSATDRYGRIDCLINNAGTPVRGRFEELHHSVMEKVITGNLITALFTTRAALPEIMKTNGSIIFISSLAAIHGIPYNSPYCAAKAGIDALAESLRIELTKNKVHIGLLHVGLVEIYPGKTVMGPDGNHISLNRSGDQTEKDVVKAILHLVRKRKTEMTLTPLGKLMKYVQKISPSLVEYILIRKLHSKQFM